MLVTSQQVPPGDALHTAAVCAIASRFPPDARPCIRARQETALHGPRNSPARHGHTTLIPFKIDMPTRRRYSATSCRPARVERTIPGYTMSHTQPPEDCYFCKVSRGEADPFIFENRSFVGIFDTHPVNPGHALVIPRRHVVSIFALNQQEQADYFDALQRIKRVIETTHFEDLYLSMLERADLKNRPKDHIETVLQLQFLGNRPDAYTVGNNDGREAGRSIDHLHVIVLPRYRQDVENPRGGIRNVIPSRAQYQRR